MLHHTSAYIEAVVADRRAGAASRRPAPARDAPHEWLPPAGNHSVGPARGEPDGRSGRFQNPIKSDGAIP